MQILIQEDDISSSYIRFQIHYHCNFEDIIIGFKNYIEQLSTGFF